ncbi:MAG: hypothetical protein GOV15_01855 [Candidatus Diapherotrites archaeon]|nr:hypothetical protein [Candidatus Diapherotrites archaeon]
MNNRPLSKTPLWVGWVFSALVVLTVYLLKPDVAPFTKQLSQITASSGTFLIVMSYALGPISYYLKWKQSARPFKKLFGVTGFTLVTIHASLAINYFMRAGLVAENVLAVTFGFISLFIFAVAAISSKRSIAASLGKNWLKIQHTGYLALLLAVVHFVIIGEGYYFGSEVGSVVIVLAALTLLLRVIRLLTDRSKK